MDELEAKNNGPSGTTAYVPIACSRCGKNNSPDAKCCNGCVLAFDLEYAAEVDQRKEDMKDKMDRLSTEFAKSPEVLDMLLKALETLKNSQRNKSSSAEVLG